MLEDVATESLVGTGQFDVSRTGTLVYRRRTSGAATMMMLQWVDPAGKREPMRVKPSSYLSPRLSPDGKRVALTIGEGETTDIWVYNSQRDAMTRLTFGGGGCGYSIWSPDGQYVVFGSIGKGIFQARSDGAGQPQPVIEGKFSLSNSRKLLESIEETLPPCRPGIRRYRRLAGGSSRYHRRRLAHTAPACLVFSP
jgi:hypothetical protein